VIVAIGLLRELHPGGRCQPIPTAKTCRWEPWVAPGLNPLAREIGKTSHQLSALSLPQQEKLKAES